MMSEPVSKARKDSFVRALRKCNIWQRTDTTYELDEFSSKCDVPALSSPSATSIYPLLWELAMDVFSGTVKHTGTYPPQHTHTHTAATSLSENE